MAAPQLEAFFAGLVLALARHPAPLRIATQRSTAHRSAPPRIAPLRNSTQRNV
jgi:hypothetical protein